MYKYNSKDVLNMFRGGSLIYNAEQEVCTRLFSGNTPGFWYDPNDLDAEKLKWRRNLFTETEFRNGVSDAPLKGGTYSATTFEGLTQGTGIRIDSNPSVGTYIYKSFAHLPGVQYVFSAYVRMLDGSVPIIGESNIDTNADLCIVAKGGLIYNPNRWIIDLGGGLYRVIGLVPLSGTSQYFGFVKYSANSTRPVIVSGYQMEIATSASPYQPFTDFNSEFIAQFPNHALYQDASGTVPVSTGGQPLGLMLDKSKGLVLGPEKFIESEITIRGKSQKIDSTTYRIYSSTGAASGVQLTNKLTANRTYLVEFTIESFAIVGDGIAAESIGGTTLAHKTVGRKRVFITPLTTTFFLKRSGICDAIVKDITVKEIAGSHAFQATSSLKPIFRQTPILGSELVVNGSFDINSTGWSTYLCTIGSVNQKGKLTATGTGNPQITQSASAFAGKTVQVSADFSNRVGGSSTKITLYHSSTGDIATASSTATSGSLSFTVTVPATFGGSLICMCNSMVSGDSVEFDNVLVKEITGYYSDRNYLEFDGIDDFLQTNLIDLTATDKISLFTGVRKLSDSATRVVFELSADLNNNNGGFYLTAPSSANRTNYSFSSKGTVSTYATVTGYTSPTTNVLCARSDISGDRLTVRIDGVEKFVSTTDQGSGNFGNYPLFIGRRGGLYIPFRGNLYNLIGVGNLVSDTDTILLEKLMALKTGVTLNA